MSGEKTLTMAEVIRLGTEIGVQTGIDYINKQKEIRRKSRYDRRLRNTKLLLKEYRKLAIHSKNASYSRKINAIEVLDELDDHEYDEDGLYIESIKCSKERTAIIVDHIRKMMKIFYALSHKASRPEEKRKYEIIYDMYINPKESTAEELAVKFKIDDSQIYRDINAAVETLTSLVFGIDGLKIF